MRIAIVEDEKDVAGELTTLLEIYEKNTGAQLSYVCFADAVSFLGNYRTDYDLVFMDIKLPGMNGMKAAGKLREMDKNIIIVFVTNMRQYAIKGYAVEALDFIVKPVDALSLNTLMDKAFRIISSRGSHDSITIKTKGGLQRILISDLHYVEVRKHKLTYHTTYGEIDSWGAMADIEKMLPMERFSRCNNCYLVSLQHIKSLGGDDVVVGRDILKIARTRKKEFLADFARFLGEGGNLSYV